MLFTILICFAFAFSLAIFGRFIKKYPLVVALLPLGLFVYFFQFLSILTKDKATIYEKTAWIPSFGINLNFSIDGISLLFALLITGVGTLVFTYTSAYLKKHRFLDRFYAYLSVFMGAMLGVVLSDNLLILFIFWEITSISSFFLIGFNNEEIFSRKSALLALSITGIGGLLLFVAVIIIGQITGTYTVSELLENHLLIQKSPYYLTIILLVFGAAFTKSAQFPFHFWLPGAMKAPTPVSTYLHSATMVKAGIYLLLRLTPILGGNELWNTPLVVIGSVTMLYAAFHTLFRTDMKAILAYTTIAALGILTFLIGLGTKESLLGAIVFILIHATYKATLFLITGIIDHKTGTRDVTKLSGLGKVLFPIAIISFFAAISHGGIPPTFGFVGKDLIYEATLNHPSANVLTCISLITNVLLLYAGLVVGLKPFIGNLPKEYGKIHFPEIALWLPAAILSFLCIFLGFFPNILEEILLVSALNFLGTTSETHLALWHGFTSVLAYSIVTIFLGIILYFIWKPKHNNELFINKLERISPKNIAEKIGTFFTTFSSWSTAKIQNGYLTTYIKKTILASTVILAISIWNNFSYVIDFHSFSEITFHEIVILLVLILAILFVTFTESRLVAVSSLGLLSFSICMIYMMYSAPDLAMTQFSIDTLTTVLFVLILYKLPSYLKIKTQSIKVFDGFLSISFGIVITMICLQVLMTPQNTEVSSFYAKNSYLAAHGKNVVNVILVDFRGADTMMEISVLSIAAIGVFGLIKLRLKTKERFKA